MNFVLVGWGCWLYNATVIQHKDCKVARTLYCVLLDLGHSQYNIATAEHNPIKDQLITFICSNVGWLVGVEFNAQLDTI